MTWSSSLKVLAALPTASGRISKLNHLTTLSNVLSERRIGNDSNNHIFRGPLTGQPTFNDSEEIQKSVQDSRPYWFIFSGLGSQSNALPKELFSVEPFMESLSISRKILQGLGITTEELLHPNNTSIYTCLRSGLLSLSVVQMALYETIKNLLPSVPSGLIGHSAGEILSGYADGCLNAEQVILIQDACARAMLATKKSQGGMTAVGLSWEAAQTICPPDVYPSCEHTPNSIMVSGASESLNLFAMKLEAKGVFVRNVQTCGFAPHSPFMNEASELLEEYLKDIIPNEIPRSNKWINTTALKKDWESPELKYSSRKYYTNIIRNPVWFYQALQHIPNEAVVIEMSPTCIFAGIVKESLPTAQYFSPILKNGQLNPFLSNNSQDTGNTFLKQ
ncbi:unnamed protein product [Allacma fusca]|uniref:Malonyl-CoA:ACP transacylase (MAT) domain-containing protein n=1 Tax=Allacma fusca TaxID=39272 RepID=A0A8J2PMJ5_9HEXA|nr:unnamed protein product [Allacma fusca]